MVDEIQDELEGSFEKAGDVPTSKDAIVYISKRIAPGMLEEIPDKNVPRLYLIGDCYLTWANILKIGKKKLNS